MGWIETTNDAQVAFSDENMDELVVWSSNRTANVDADLERYLTETYSDISSVSDDGDGDDDDDDETDDADSESDGDGDADD